MCVPILKRMIDIKQYTYISGFEKRTYKIKTTNI